MEILTQRSQPCLSQFLSEMNAKNIVNEPTCFKSLSNPGYIDLVITNISSNFKTRRQYQRAYWIFIKCLLSVLKHTFHRHAPKVLVYRDCRNFNRVIFKREPEDKLNQQVNEYKHFEKIFLEILNTHAPIKINYSELTMFLI